MSNLRPEFRGARSLCVCGHTGDGEESQHDASCRDAVGIVGDDGSGRCTIHGCACFRFTWKSWTPEYRAYLQEQITRVGGGADVANGCPEAPRDTPVPPPARAPDVLDRTMLIARLCEAALGSDTFRNLGEAARDLVYRRVDSVLPKATSTARLFQDGDEESRLDVLLLSARWNAADLRAALIADGWRRISRGEGALRVAPPVPDADRRRFDMMRPLPGRDLRAASDLIPFGPLDGAHVLITGATGFVGSWLAELACIARDHGHVKNLKLWIHGRDKNRVWQVGHSHEHGDTGMSECDIRELVIPDGVTHVIHCASAVSAADNAADPAAVAAMITEGTRRVASECRRVGVSRLLHVSSGSVYAPKDGGTYTETDPCRALSDPDRIIAAKVAAEYLAVGSAVPTVIARGFAMLGPRLPGQFAASQFMADAVAGRPIRVDAPRTVRSYLYASDLAVWLWTLLMRGDTTAYNVGGGTSESIYLADLARKMSEIAGGVGLRVGQNNVGTRFMPGVTKARQLCPPPMSIERAIKRWLEWEHGV